MNFKEATELEIGQHVKQKGKFNYLSWSRAVEHLRVNYPEATWRIHEFDSCPFLLTPLGYMVKVSVNLENRQYSQWHPILDGRNKPIEQPTTFQINTSIQRCLVKAIGIATGIGLALYSGEDLPTEQEQITLITDEQLGELQGLLEGDDDKGTWRKQLLEWAGIEKLGDMPSVKFNLALMGLKSRCSNDS